MSCEISLFSNCGDIERIKRALYLLNRDDITWLKECKISFSSCGSLLAVSHGKRICFLNAQWISSSSSNVYLVSWNGAFDNEISSVFACPVSSQGQSSQNVPDWICVMVGMQNGDLNFYTDQGHFLMKERLENGPVKKIRCHTGIYGNDVEEIHVMFQTVVCIVQGSSLFQTLRYARSQLAKVVQAGIDSESQIDGRNIQVRKWLFVDQDIVSDCAVVGLDVSNTFDHLLSASMYGGYETTFRSVPPHNTLILGGGTRPFLGFHYALEGGVQPPLQDVAKAVASKIISNLPIVGWFAGNKNNNKDTGEKQQRAESLVLRSSIADFNRQCTSICLSPDRRLAAVTDNLGRVLLVDLKAGLIIRIFKGYRNAQCGFVHVFDEKHKNSPSRVAIKHRRYATFLIIYTAKKGIIDIRLMTNGVRITSFTTSKNGILLYNTNGLLGSTLSHSSKRLNTAQYPCVLLDPDGKLKRFVIPFHFALDGENSKSAKDLHLLKRLKQLTRDSSSDVKKLKLEIINTVNELETTEVKKCCIEQIISDKHIPSICILICVDNIVKSMGDECIPEKLKLKILCNNVEKLCRLFMHLNSLDMEDYSCDCNSLLKEVIDQLPEKVVNVDELQSSAEEVNILNEDVSIPLKAGHTNVTLSSNDLENLQRLLLLLGNDTHNIHKVKQKVTFVTEEKTSYSFINSFELYNSEDSIKLKESLSQDGFEQLASDIYNELFKKLDPISILKWQIYVKCGNIDPKCLVKLLLTYWLSIPLTDDASDKMHVVGRILYEITNMTDDGVCVPYNEVSPWWECIRVLLVEAASPIKSMMVAMMCKEVAHLLEREKDVSGEARAWENVTKDGAKWSLLIGKLEDISLLSIVLSKYPTIDDRQLPAIEVETFDINLKYVYNRGKGSVSELIGRWLCVIGVSPRDLRLDELKHNIVENETKVNNITDDSLPDCQDEDVSNYERKHNHLFEKLDLLRKQFPHSTHSDYLILNMCWEYASAWIKDISHLNYLEAVLLCLDNIICPFLCRGVCSLIWLTHLKRTFESSCKLLNKVGKLPKERLCLQDVGLSDANVIIFLNLITKFISKSLNSTMACDRCRKPILRFENIWDTSVPSFSEIVLDAPIMSFDTQHLNFQVASVMYYQCYFNVKFTKPLNMLFDCDLHVLFDATTENYTRSENSFAKVKSQRLRFIKKLILPSLDLVSSVDADVGRELHIREMANWMDKIYTLARIWGIDNDYLRREQVVGLYELGYDSVAEDIFSTVAEPSQLVNNLITLCGTRLRHFFETSSDVSGVIASLPPQLMAYLQTLESSSGSFADVSLESTKKLVEKIITQCSADPQVDSQQMRLAALMLEACNIMETL